MNKKQVRINGQITAPSVRLINSDGQQVGVVNAKDAQLQAEKAGLDLVEIAPNVKPPVCKIMDFGKYKYELAKKEKENRKKQHTIVTKEIRFRPKTDDHDYEFKMRHARKFIEQGNRVKATVRFRGRENVHREYGAELLNRFKEDMEDVAKIEVDTKLEGGQMILFLVKK